MSLYSHHILWMNTLQPTGYEKSLQKNWMQLMMLMTAVSPSLMPAMYQPLNVMASVYYLKKKRLLIVYVMLILMILKFHLSLRAVSNLWKK